MTRDELDELDTQLGAETISEEEYCDTLRSEVSRLHPDYDDCDVQNMVRMQLRVMALETMLSEDNNAARLVERGPAPRGWDAGGDELGEDRPAGGTESQLSEGEGEGEESPDKAATGQGQGQDEQAQTQTESGREGKGSLENGQGEVPGGSPSEGSEGGKDPSKGDGGGGKDQSQGSGGKDQKNKGKAGGGCWWWTWQIVPESLTFGQQEPKPDHESNQGRDRDNSAGSAEAEPRPKEEPEGDVIDAEFEEIKD